LVKILLGPNLPIAQRNQLGPHHRLNRQAKRDVRGAIKGFERMVADQAAELAGGPPM
jgi:hypothetical protein